jgi:hypothetical protein
MRATIEPHNQPAIAALMEQLGTTNPSIAVNFIINSYRTGHQGIPNAAIKQPAKDDPLDLSGLEF